MRISDPYCGGFGAAGIFLDYGTAIVITFIVLAVVLILRVIDSSMMAAMMVVGMLVVAFVLGMGLLSGGFYLEGKRVNNSIIEYLNSDQMQTLFNDHKSSPIYQWVVERLDYFGFDTSVLDPSYLRQQVSCFFFFFASPLTVFPLLPDIPLDLGYLVPGSGLYGCSQE